MTEQFNLSEKIETLSKKDFSDYGFDRIIRVVEIQEFIRLLKEEANQSVRKFGYNAVHIKTILELAGEKLT